MFYFTESIKSSQTKKKRLLKILLLSATSGMLALVLICGCVLMKMKITRKGLKVKKENLELPLFDLTIIADATSNFSSEHKIGEGGFGPVYKVKNRISSVPWLLYLLCNLYMTPTGKIVDGTRNSREKTVEEFRTRSRRV